MSVGNQIVIVTGFLGADAEVRRLTNGDDVLGFSVAVTEKWDQGRQEHTEWFRVSYFGQRDVEFLAKALRKGGRVYFEGKARSRKYTGNDGVERTVVEYIARKVSTLEPASQGQGDERGGYGSSSRGSARDDRRDDSRAGSRGGYGNGNGRDARRDDRRDDRREDRRGPPPTRDSANGRDANGRPAYQPRQASPPPASNAAGGWNGLDDDIPFEAQFR